jgi:uncharacterized protein (DUF488 family)
MEDRQGSPGRAAPGWGGRRVLSVGHSNRPLEDLLAVLRAHGVTCLVDVRTVPRSRHNPQHEGRALAEALPREGIRYVHLSALGGLRRPLRASPNGAWRDESFRGFADHMLTCEFEEGLMALRGLAREGPVAVMCAEAVPWRCHRSLIADALWARGVVVEHVMGAAPGRSQLHRPTPFALMEGRRVTYPAASAVADRRASRSAGPADPPRSR